MVDPLGRAARAGLQAAWVLTLAVALVLSCALILGLRGTAHCPDLRPS